MKILKRTEVVPAILVVVAFIAGTIESPYFLDVRYLLNASSLYVEGGILALAMTLVIISGQIDLSVAAMLALVAGVSAKLFSVGWSTPLVVCGALVFGSFLGLLNGLLISKFRLPSFVVTLGTMAAYRGIAQIMLGAESMKLPPSFVGIDMKYFPGTPIPLPLILFLAMAGGTGFVLHRTVLGRWIFAIGTNLRATFYSGISTTLVTCLVFSGSGLFAGIGGLLIDSRVGVARYDHAHGLELDVITAVVLGGASISGGSGSILGTVLALLLVGLLRTGMGVANVTAEYQLAAVGTLLILAILIRNFVDRLASKREAHIRRAISIST